MKIKINISKKRINIGDLRKAQRDDIDATLRLVAACMVGPDGDYLERDAALGILDSIDLETLEEEVIPAFMDALEVTRQKAINPQSGGRRS
jgi:hypothetical protein